MGTKNKSVIKRKFRNKSNVTPLFPWIRQPNESDVAYDAFETYLDMGSDRSVIKVGQKLKKNRTIIGRWSSKHNWQERVRAYDQHMGFIKQGAVEDVLIEVSKRHATQAQDILQVLMQPNRELINRLKAKGKLEGLDKLTDVELIVLIRSITPAIKQMIEAERLARGMDINQDKNVSFNQWDYQRIILEAFGNMSDEEFERLLKDT